MPICSHMVKRSARKTLRDTSMTLSPASARRECRSTGVPGGANAASASFVRSMEKDDEIAVLTFSTEVHELKPVATIRAVGESLAD